MTTLDSPHSKRPFWSVMIPAYRSSASYLQRTLESVLQQDPGGEIMQIEVVDDQSPDGDIAGMVHSIAGERVKVSRTPENLGLAGCWNTCIERARGEWVHLLHHDDYVLPGFYEKMGGATVRHPDLALIACRCFCVDEQDIIQRVTPRIPELESGAKCANHFFYANPLQCPGVIMRRTFYEAHGTFRSDLKFVLDVEMWARAVGLGGGLVLPEVLAGYRDVQGRVTNRLERNGDALRDIERLIEIYTKRYPTFIPQRARMHLCEKALEQARRFSKMGDAEAARANWQFWRQNFPVILRLKLLTRRVIMNLAQKLN